MIYLLLCICCSSAINIIFKIAGRKNADSFHIILINYIFAIILGIIISEHNFGQVFKTIYPHLPVILLTGILFIAMFYLVSLSVNSAGITRTAIASRMSLIIPVIFSVVYFNDLLTAPKITGIVLALGGLYLSIFRKVQNKSINDHKSFLLPVVIFVGAGIVDSLLKYSQATFLNAASLTLYTSFLFLIAGISGFLVFFIKNQAFNNLFRQDVLILGAVLGFVNYGSTYFFIQALNKSGLVSASVFAINHIGIVLFSIFVSLLFFREKLRWYNWIGIVLCIFAVLLLTMNHEIHT